MEDWIKQLLREEGVPEVDVEYFYEIAKERLGQRLRRIVDPEPRQVEANVAAATGRVGGGKISTLPNRLERLPKLSVRFPPAGPTKGYIHVNVEGSSKPIVASLDEAGHLEIDIPDFASPGSVGAENLLPLQFFKIFMRDCFQAFIGQAFYFQRIVDNRSERIQLLSLLQLLFSDVNRPDDTPAKPCMLINAYLHASPIGL